MQRKGVVAVIESLLAATIFFVFLINVLPSFATTPRQSDVISQRSFSALQALDRGRSLRPLVLEQNVSGIEDEINQYFPTFTVAVGLSFVNRTTGKYTGGTHSRDFQVNKSRSRREILHTWIDAADDITLEVNGQNVLETSSTSHQKINIEEATVDGSNTLNISSDSGRLHYAVEIYNYIQSRDLPDEGELHSTGYTVSGANNTLQPSEVKLFLWR
jgi:hypothetical protein